MKIYVTCIFFISELSPILELFPFLAHPSRRLKVSYCDHSPSVVVIHLSIRPYTIFKQHLLLNHWANFNQISQDWPLDNTDWNMFKDLESMQNSGCHGNQKKNL